MQEHGPSRPSFILALVLSFLFIPLTKPHGLERIDAVPEMYFVKFDVAAVDAEHDSVDHANQLFEFARTIGSDVFFLQDRESLFTPRWLVMGMPTDYVHSESGEHGKSPATNHVVMAGGYMRSDISAAMHHLIHEYFKKPQSDQTFTIDVPMQSVFEDGSIFWHWFDDNVWPPKHMSLLEAYQALQSQVGSLNAAKQFAAFSRPPLYELNHNGKPSGHRLEVYIDNKRADTYGEGGRLTQLKFWTDMDLFQANLQSRLPVTN